MKKYITAFLLLFLVGCSNQNDEAVEIIEQSIEKNQNLENGTFEVVQVFVTDDGTVEEETRGSFINKGEDNSEWHTINRVESWAEGEQAEYLQADGTRYQKFPGVNEWEETHEELTNFPDAMKPLVNDEELENVKSIEMEEAGDRTKYIVTLNDKAGKQIVEENVEAMEENIEYMKEELESPEEVIAMMEREVDDMKETDYTDIIFSYVVDQAGHMVEIHNEYTISSPTKSTLEANVKLYLTDYNLSSTDGLIPEL